MIENNEVMQSEGEIIPVRLGANAAKRTNKKKAKEENFQQQQQNKQHNSKMGKGLIKQTFL